MDRLQQLNLHNSRNEESENLSLEPVKENEDEFHSIKR